MAATAAQAALPVAASCSATTSSWSDCASDAALLAPLGVDPAQPAPGFDAIDERAAGAGVPLDFAAASVGGSLGHASALGTSAVLGIPEPHTLALMGAGLVAMAFLAVRRRRD